MWHFLSAHAGIGKTHKSFTVLLMLMLVVLLIADVDVDVHVSCGYQ